MKRVILVLCVLTIVLFSFRLTSQPRSAQVYKCDGFYVYLRCAPDNYSVLGTLRETKFNWSENPRNVFDNISKCVKQHYPDADGVIFSSEEIGRATCIRLNKIQINKGNAVAEAQ